MLDLEEYNFIDSDGIDEFDEFKFYDMRNSGSDGDFNFELKITGKKRSRLEREPGEKVWYKLCACDGCKKIGYYRYDNSKILYCNEHKTDDMYNPKRRLCQEDKCKNHAYYATEGKLPIYCKSHKSESMINVLTLRCNYDGCKKYPSYNYPNTKGRGDRCKLHKTEDMVDVRNPKCIIDGCDKFARFECKTKCYTHRIK